MKFFLGFLALAVGTVTAAAPQATFYLVDIGHGNVAFVVSPSGETMLLDCGPPQVVDRIYDFMQQKGIAKIDYLVVSHFEADHMGAVAALSKKVPIVNYVDHGESVTVGKSDEWWKGRRAPWWREGIAAHDSSMMEAYKAARATGHHIVVKPGDKVPIKGLDVLVVAAAGKNISQPLTHDTANPACSHVQLRAEDDAEDGQSVGVTVTLGKFRFVYLGDMTWNNSYRLFCPVNLIGHVDAYLVTHHAQSMNTDRGEYYGGLACCSVAEVQGLHPRVALLSMGAQGHKYGTPDAMKTVREQGMDLWQTEKITGGGEAGLNAPDDFIANIGGARSERVPNIKLVANPDSSFTVSNDRNGFSKSYPPHK
jgi:beta-lactamase superfamily II metal-dependent hydrolase